VTTHNANIHFYLTIATEIHAGSTKTAIVIFAASVLDQSAALVAKAVPVLSTAIVHPATTALRMAYSILLESATTEATMIPAGLMVSVMGIGAMVSSEQRGTVNR
jgi:hypothetical protein